MARDPWTTDVAVRRARKPHTCEGNGGDPASHADDCTSQISPNDVYVEYFGEAPAYQSGSRHCSVCAVFFGYVDRMPLPSPPQTDQNRRSEEGRDRA